MFGWLVGCCACSGACCFSVKVNGCATTTTVPRGLSGVSITLTEQGTGTVVMDGVSDSSGMVVDEDGAIIRVCPSGTKTYDMTWDYLAGNKDRMQAHVIVALVPVDSFTFNGSIPCPTGDAVFYVAVTPL